ncbi:hypothetical protein CsSME_00049850 [Camellia sinensis var. sinensis]
MEGEVVSNTRGEFGGSLPVENVQALASSVITNSSKDIPHRYLRPEVEFDQVSADESLQIPVIDMTKLLVNNDTDQAYESAKLHSACKAWGFFQLMNHGISEAIEEMKKETEEFFKLSLEEKMVCAQLPNSIEGYGQAFVVSEDQKLDWGDMLFLLPLPLPLRNLRFWPTTPPSFRSTLDRYSSELKRVAISLLRMMGKNLGLDQEAFTALFEDCVQGIRMNYYPPCELASKVIGLTPHSDATGLTLLIQVNQVQGLQIKKDGEWVPIKPLPGAIIINIGDILEILSNGEYSSIEHRAAVNTEKERLSIAGFHSPNLKAMVGPFPDLVNEENAAKYKTISHEDYVKLIISSKLDVPHNLKTNLSFRVSIQHAMLGDKPQPFKKLCSCSYLPPCIVEQNTARTAQTEPSTATTLST